MQSVYDSIVVQQLAKFRNKTVHSHSNHSTLNEFVWEVVTRINDYYNLEWNSESAKFLIEDFLKINHEFPQQDTLLVST